MTGGTQDACFKFLQTELNVTKTGDDLGFRKSQQFLGIFSGPSEFAQFASRMTVEVVFLVELPALVSRELTPVASDLYDNLSNYR